MLTEQEYNEIKPHRDKIFAFELTQSYKGGAMHIIDRIRQRLNYGAICFDCSGSKANALNDAITLIRLYEENVKNNEITT